jgi:isoamylase
MPKDSHSSKSEFPEQTQKPPRLRPASKGAHTTAELAELERLLSLCEVQSVRSGVPYPLGATIRANGVNFAIFSRHATGVRLDLFNRAQDARPSRTILLNPVRNKTGDVWHVWLEGIRPGQLYGYRFAGPYAPQEGHRFNPDKLVVDTCATAIAPVPRRSYRKALGYDPSSPLRDLSYSTVTTQPQPPSAL